MHLAKSGRIIIKLKKPLTDGQMLVDKQGRKLARVSELIGPVKAPYASAIPLTNNVKKYIESAVYATSEPPAKKHKSRKGRKR